MADEINVGSVVRVIGAEHRANNDKYASLHDGRRFEITAISSDGKTASARCLEPNNFGKDRCTVTRENIPITEQI